VAPRALSGDTLAAVRRKEHELEALAGDDGPLARWKAAADLWCAAWFWTTSPRRTAGWFETLLSRFSRPVLASRADSRRLARPLGYDRQGAAVLPLALEFPEVFFDATGRPRADAGFDAVLGIPRGTCCGPTLVTRTAASGRDVTRARSPALRATPGSTGTSATGTPTLPALPGAGDDAHAAGRPNRPSRPSGWRTDAVAVVCAMRCWMGARRCIVAFDNTDAIFPIHRSVRFLALTAGVGSGPTVARCRFGVRDPSELDAVPDAVASGADDRLPITLTPRLLRRLSGDDLDIPESSRHQGVSESSSGSPPLPCSGEHGGLERGVRSRAERNRRSGALRQSGRRSSGRPPVLEGKHLRPFTVDLHGSSLVIGRSRATTLLDEVSTFGSTRLAYRDVASATNRLTLIAAVVPPGSSPRTP